MFQVCIVGAGFSGICAAAKFKTELSSSCEISIFDENSDFGGVWLKNTYPGCACEVPSHLYSYSFEQNPDWSQAYCQQAEILSYLQNVASKYNLYKHANFRYKIQSMIWEETNLKWKVTAKNLANLAQETIQFDIVINAQGRFSSPEIPNKFRDFSGPVIHSANWDDKVNLNGKTVAVVGNGASGSQIIPAISKKVKRLIVVQRHASWVMPKSQFRFPAIVKLAFRKVPGLVWLYRNYLKLLFEFNVSVFRIGTLGSRIAPALSKFNLIRQVNPKLRKQLSPDYAFGCKRIILSNEFYSALTQPNCTLLNGNIERVTEDAIIMENGDRENVDVIVLATGFQVLNYCDGIAVKGKDLDGMQMLDLWREDKPKAYLGIMSSLTPNFFLLLGPNVSTGYTSLILQLENQVTWIILAVKELISRNHKMICVKAEAEDAYMQEINKKMKNTIYGSSECGNCNSWYLNQSNHVIEIYPDTSSSYVKRTSNFNAGHFEFS